MANKELKAIENLVHLSNGGTLVDMKKNKMFLTRIVVEEEGIEVEYELEEIAEFDIYIDPKDIEIEELKALLKQCQEEIERLTNEPK